MQLKKAAIHSVAEIYNRISKILTVFMLARLLIKTDFGYYNYVLALVGIVLLLLDAGLNILVVLRGTGKHLNRLFRIFFNIKISAILLVVLVLGFIFSAATPFIAVDTRNLIIMVAMLAIGWDLSSFLASAHRASFDFTAEAIAKILWNTIFILSLIVMMLLDYSASVLDVVLAQLVSFIIAISWSLHRFKGRGVVLIDFKPRTFGAAKITLAISLPFAVSAASASLFNTIDSLMLGYFAKFEFLASFSTAQKFMLLMYLPLALIQGFMLPYLSEQTKNAGVAFSIRQLRVALVIGVVSAASLGQICILAIDWVVIPIMGIEKFSDVAWMTRVMILCLPAMYMHAIIWTLLVTNRFTVLANIPASIIVVLMIVVDYVLIAFGRTELIIWSPVYSNLLMLIGLAWIYKRKMDVQPISFKVGSLLFGISCAQFISHNLFLPIVAETVLRISFVILAALITFRIIMKNKIVKAY